MTREQISEAIRYNVEKSERLWNSPTLKWPFSQNPGSTCFVGHVAVFQQVCGLRVDGKLGPDTLAAMRARHIADEGDPVPAQVSNCLILRGERLEVPEKLADAGFTVANWLDDGVERFAARIRSREPQHIVLHESVTLDVATTARVLKRRELGVHLMVAPDGSMTNHNDLVLDQPAHANQLNSTSVGIEIINPYSPAYSRPPFSRVVSARWWTWVPQGAPRQYVLPTSMQMEALKGLVVWLADVLPGVPLAFPTLGLDHRKRKIQGWQNGAAPSPGIVAHRDFSSHADGRWPLEQLATEGEP